MILVTSLYKHCMWFFGCKHLEDSETKSARINNVVHRNKRMCDAISRRRRREQRARMRESANDNTKNHCQIRYGHSKIHGIQTIWIQNLENASQALRTFVGFMYTNEIMHALCVGFAVWKTYIDLLASRLMLIITRNQVDSVNGPQPRTQKQTHTVEWR